MISDKIRCNWANSSENMQLYHDTEYGFPVEDNNEIFERLMLEAYQAGLSWQLVLNKRDGFNRVFFNFDLKKVAALDNEYLESISQNPDIIRNKLKLNATVHNAKICLQKIDEFGSLLNYFNQLPHAPDELKDCVKIMKKQGFKFIGNLVLEEFFMSIGLNKVKHSKDCFLYDN